MSYKATHMYIDMLGKAKKFLNQIRKDFKYILMTDYLLKCWETVSNPLSHMK